MVRSCTELTEVEQLRQRHSPSGWKTAWRGRLDCFGRIREHRKPAAQFKPGGNTRTEAEVGAELPAGRLPSREVYSRNTEIDWPLPIRH